MNVFTRRRGDAEILNRAETAERAESACRRRRLMFAELGMNLEHRDRKRLRRNYDSSAVSAISARIPFFLRVSASPRDPILQSIT
jgi:hypothetical protein